MTHRKRVFIMIGMEWPVKHHYEVLAGIQRYARERGHWECTVAPYGYLSLTGDKLQERPDGIIGRLTSHAAALAREAGVPVVNTWLSSPVTDVPTVTHDAEESGRIAARHLMQRGFRTYGFLSFRGDRNGQLQLKGFRSVLRQRRYPCSECWVSANYEQSVAKWAQFRTKLERWSERWSGPIAVFSTGDVLCRYLAEICQRRNLKVPRDVALVGSYNDLIISSHSNPTLSSTDYGFERVGYRAAALLADLMDGAPEPAAAIRVPPAGLVIRQSSEAFAVDDSVVAGAVQFIIEHLHERLDVGDVADAVRVGRQSLLRLFRKTLGQTIHETITALRLERVKQRLLDPGAVLKTVARECGFRDAVHLYKVFQQAEGVSPSQYREDRVLKDFV